MFCTLEELKAKYPIGIKLNYSKNTMTQRYFYARPEDIVEYRKLYKTVEVINDELVECTWDVEEYDSVDGYLFDGTHWWPAENTWDGWLPIHIIIEENEDDDR